jgi:hypothetical protein
MNEYLNEEVWVTQGFTTIKLKIKQILKEKKIFP